jgi:hypothetical protein
LTQSAQLRLSEARNGYDNASRITNVFDGTFAAGSSCP